MLSHWVCRSALPENMSLATHRRGITATLIAIGALGLLSGLGFGAEVERPLHRSAAANASVQPRFSRTFDVSHFQKGNVHTHTTLSDGGSSPEHTIAWYRSHGYQFLALTDHNKLSRPARYAALQVVGDNLVARRLYARLGYTMDLYGYRYYEQPTLLTSSR